MQSSRLNYIRKDFTTRVEKLIKKGKLIVTENNYIIDPAYKNFVQHVNPDKKLTEESYDIWSLYDLLFTIDTTENKEYFSWLINLYLKQTKRRYPLDHEEYDEAKDLFGGERFSFFEDSQQLTTEFIQFNDLKKTKILTPEKKDIYNYDNIGDFRFIFKSLFSGGNAITPQEMNLIREGYADIIESDETHYLINLKTKKAAKLFGINSTWCTASNDTGVYRDMYDSYIDQGEILLLIDKKPKSSKADRFQIHFPTKQIMMLNNTPNLDVFTNIVTTNNNIKNRLIEYYVNQETWKERDWNESTFLGLVSEMKKIGLDFNAESFIDLIERVKLKEITMNLNLEFNKKTLDRIFSFDFIEILSLSNINDYNIVISDDSSLKGLRLKSVNNVSLSIQNKVLKNLSLSKGSITELKVNLGQLEILKLSNIMLPDHINQLDLSGCNSLKILDLINTSIKSIRNLHECSNINFFLIQNNKILLPFNDFKQIGSTLLCVLLKEKGLNENDIKRLKEISKKEKFGLII